jgi:L-asparagine transporter-like permease
LAVFPDVNTNMVHFMISYVVAFIAFGLIATRYVCPNIRRRPPKEALQYPMTLLVRLYFLACIAAFYATMRDPMFLILAGIVAFGFVMTLVSLLLDRRRHAEA